MAIPHVARAFGATTRFDNPRDPYEFPPSRTVSYNRNDDSKVTVEDERAKQIWVANPGNLSTEYPHAGNPSMKGACDLSEPLQLIGTFEPWLSSEHDRESRNPAPEVQPKTQFGNDQIRNL